MKDVCGVAVSRGHIAKTLGRVSQSLAAPYDEALHKLREEPVLNIDETGHRELGKRFWTWVFRADDFAVFHIDNTRAAGVLTQVLGREYPGTIGCDYYSAYHKYLRDNNAKAQFCLAISSGSFDPSRSIPTRRRRSTPSVSWPPCAGSSESITAKTEPPTPIDRN